MEKTYGKTASEVPITDELVPQLAEKAKASPRDILRTMSDVRVVWGINRWVLVEAAEGSLERQVSTRRELADLLLEAGVARGRVDELASEHWRARPAGAALPSATARGAVWRATGLSRMGTLLLVLGVAAAFFILRFFW